MCVRWYRQRLFRKDKKAKANRAGGRNRLVNKNLNQFGWGFL